MTRTLGPGLRLFSLDWPEADPQLRTDRLRKNLHEAFATADQSVVVTYGNSADQATLDRFAETLGENMLDCLIIDGDHSAQGVRGDFDRYRRFVRAGGIIVFHDIVPHDTMPFGVADFWREIKQVGRAEEIVEAGGWERRRGGGIGVWWNITAT